ncbi:glycosyltransferase family 2 protein [Pseudomonadota bacterium]
MKSYDCTVIVTAYEAGKTIANCIRSIFEQEVDDYQVLILVGYDYSKDDTFKKLVELGKECPQWAEYRIIVNKKPNIIINGCKTGRSNFLNCYKEIKGRAVLFCDCDDEWSDKKKLAHQLNYSLQTGRGSYTSMATNNASLLYNPFIFGNRIIFSSLCIPSDLLLNNLVEKVRLLDWYIVCLCYEGPGLKYINGDVKYSAKNGSWTSLSLVPRVKNTLSTAGIMLDEGGFNLLSRIGLRIYMTWLNRVLKGVENCKKISC